MGINIGAIKLHLAEELPINRLIKADIRMNDTSKTEAFSSIVLRNSAPLMVL